MGQVDVDIPTDSTVSSVLTLDALDALDDFDIKESDQVRVVIKAVNVIQIKE